MAGIYSADLKLGDILITSPKEIVSHCGIVGGTYKTAAGNERVGMIYHATGGGMKAFTPPEWTSKYKESGVFRLTNPPADGLQAVGAAAIKLKSRCTYGVGRAFFESWTGTSTFGPSAKGRLLDAQARLGFGEGKFLIEVFCSEFVILAYQIGAKGDENSPLFINLDGKHALPKDLRNWILQRSSPGGKWSVMGEFLGG